MQKPQLNMQMDLSRRNFLKGSAAMTAASLLGGGNVSAEAATVAPNANSTFRPNYLFIIVDEMRAPMSYESAALQQFRKTHLPTQEKLRAQGIEFKRHYAASVACVPSRASLFTGHYPSLHGVSSTDGAAKTLSDPGMFWLDPNTVPTMGDWFRAAGYRTYWKGKWHISHADITIPGTRNGLSSYNSDGSRNAEREALYLQAGRLEEYGFTGWIGPEPHGSNPLNSGSSAKGALGRDQAIAGQAIDLLQQLEGATDTAPWMMVVSFINPHDIVLWGVMANLGGQFDFHIDADVPMDLFTDAFWESYRETLATKPSAQKSYRDGYQDYFQKIVNPNYLRFYYQLHKNIDVEVGKVYSALQKSRFFNDTVVVFTADHGDLLGSHGGMFQKWHTAYDEALRVPLIFSHPSVTSPRSVNLATSHVDLLPTLLGLAGVDSNSVQQKLATTHTEAQALVGRNLSKVLLETVDPATLANDPVYFMTDDEISRGSDQDNFLGLPYASVTQPNHVEAVIAQYAGKLWKYTRYFDNPQFWSKPGTVGNGASDSILKPLTPEARIGQYTVPCQVTNKNEPVAEEFELYNLTNDPTELQNLYGNSLYAEQQTYMANVLAQQRTAKRLKPQSGQVPGS